MFTFRLWTERDFSDTDGWFKCEGGEGLLYPPELWESNESFRRRLKQFPEGCWACVNQKDEAIGYMFSHPWLKDRVVPINCIDFVLPEKPDCFYIHDIAVLPQYRKNGIASVFLEKAKELSRKCGFSEIRGVSVLDSYDNIWQRKGFRVLEEIEYVKGIKGKVIELRLDKTEEKI